MAEKKKVKAREAKTAMVSVRLRPSVKKMIDNAALDPRFKSQSHVIELAIREFVRKYDPQPEEWE